MPFKKIVVPLTGAERDRAALAAGFAAARPFGGHVEALFVTPDPSQAVPFIGVPVPPEVLQSVIDSAGAIANTALTAARGSFEIAAKEAGAEILSQPTPSGVVSCSFCEMQGGFIGAVLEAAKLADLVVFGPAPGKGGPDMSAAFTETLMQSARPVLLSRQSGPRDLLPRIVIGWDGGAAAAHALSASLPLLSHAGTVELWSVQEGEARPAMLDAPRRYLALHGVQANPRVIACSGEAAGAVLLAEAEAAGASLLVLGGYGHSRLGEVLFGGATVHALAHATIPVFMVH
jgi:nucleotide-binding universal stress UspA family protein